MSRVEGPGIEEGHSCLEILCALHRHIPPHRRPPPPSVVVRCLGRKEGAYFPPPLLDFFWYGILGKGDPSPPLPKGVPGPSPPTPPQTSDTSPLTGGRSNSERKGGWNCVQPTPFRPELFVLCSRFTETKIRPLLQRGDGDTPRVLRQPRDRTRMRFQGQ